MLFTVFNQVSAPFSDELAVMPDSLAATFRIASCANLLVKPSILNCLTAFIARSNIVSSFFSAGFSSFFSAGFPSATGATGASGIGLGVTGTGCSSVTSGGAPLLPRPPGALAGAGGAGGAGGGAGGGGGGGGGGSSSF